MRWNSTRRSIDLVERDFADVLRPAVPPARRARPRRRGARLRRPRARRATTSSRSRCSTPSARRRRGCTRSPRAISTRSRRWRRISTASTPGGMLAITRWINLPPRDVLKLFATAIAALERRRRRRTRPAARADQELEDGDAAGEERRVHASGDRRAGGILPRALLRRRVLPGHRARAGQPLQRAGRVLVPRRCAPRCSGRSATRSSSATSSPSRRRPTTGRTSSTSSAGARCRSSWR